MLIGSLILGELLRPKPQEQKAASLKDFSIPTADESRAIAVVCGTVKIDGANVVWYGDLKSQKIVKRVMGALLFNHTDVPLGFRYSVGLHFALCHGVVDELKAVLADDREAWTGSVTSGDFQVNAPRHFGGDSEEDITAGGEGGLFANCTFYNGNEAQNPDSYLNSILSGIIPSTAGVPAYRGVSHLVWKGSRGGSMTVPDGGKVKPGSSTYLSGYIGINTNLKPMAFVVKRIPNYLNSAYATIGGSDGNPADFIYEILTNDRWGLGLTSNFIDIASFQYVQQLLFNEGMGYSEIWDSPTAISDAIEKILNFIDGVLYTDLVTGLITLKIARNDYDVTTLPSFNEDNIADMANYSRGSWDDTTNEVVVTYIDRAKKYKERPAIAQDLANVRIQGGVVSTKISYDGCSNSTVAANLAFRDLRALTIPLSKCTIRVNRDAISLRPASVLKLSWVDYGLVNILMRIVRIRYGELKSGIIELDLVQDVFSLSSSIYGVPNGDGYVDPNATAITPATFRVFEAPFFVAGGEKEKFQVVALEPGAGQYSFNSYFSENNSTYLQAASGDTYTPSGTLVNSYPKYTPDRDTTTSNFVVTPSNPDNMVFLRTISQSQAGSGENLFYAESPDGTLEIMSFETITPVGDGTYRLNNIWRGLLDTVPKAHPAGTRLWFFSEGQALSDGEYPLGSSGFVKIESLAAQSVSSLSTNQGISFARRPYRPYPPGNVRINGSTTALTVPDTENDVVVAWSSRNRLTQLTMIKQNDGDVTAEVLTTYNIKIFGETNNLLRNVTGLTALTYTYLVADQKNDNLVVGVPTLPLVLTFQLFAVRDGLQSFQAQIRTVTRTGGTAPSDPAYSIPGESYTPPPTGSTIGGIPVSPGTPPSNGQTLVYNSTTGTWEYTSASAGNATQIQSRPVAATAPTTGQVLGWNGTTWLPVDQTGGGGGSLNGDVTGAVGSNTVIRIQGRPIDSSAPSSGQALVWNGSAWTPTTIVTNPILNGDVTGNADNNTVIKIQNKPIKRSISTVVLIDNFNDNSLNTDLWTIVPNSAVTAIETGNRFELALTPNAVGYTYLVSANNYSFLNKYIQIDVLSTVTQAGYAENGFQIVLDNSNYVLFSLGAGYLVARVSTGGSVVYQIAPYFGSTLPPKMRISDSAGTINFDYWNGSSWVNFGSTSTPTWFTSAENCKAKFYAGAYGNPHSGGTFAIDNLISNVQTSIETPIPDGYVLTWVAANNNWEAIAPTGGSGSSGGNALWTVAASAVDSHTSNNTWEDVNTMMISPVLTAAGDVLVQFNCEVAGTSSDNEYISFRFVLDGSTYSEIWTKRKDELPANDERLLISFHSVFSSVTIGSHTIKVQWQDAGSNLNVNIYNRRLTALCAVQGSGGSGDPILGGDLSGVASAATVAKLQGRAFAATAPTDGQAIIWDAATTTWKPVSIPSGTLAGDVTGASGANTVTKLQGRNVAATAPSDGQALVWDNATTSWKPGTVASGGSSSPALTTYGFYSPDKPPTSPSNFDDEFGGNALTGWSSFGASDVTISQADHLLKLKQNSLSGYNLSGIYKPIPSGDWSVISKIALNAGAGSGSAYAEGGIVFYEDAADITKKLKTVSIYNTAGAIIVGQNELWTNRTTYASATQPGASIDAIKYQNFYYLRVDKVGTNIIVYYSSDGVDWNAVGASMAIGFTPLHLGLFVYNSATGAVASMICDWIRIYSTVPDYLGGKVTIGNPAIEPTLVPIIFQEDFSGATIDTGKWQTPPAGISIVGGHLEITANTTISLTSLNQFDMTGKAVSCKFVHPDPTNTGLALTAEILLDSSTSFGNYTAIAIYQNQVRMTVNSGNVRNIPFNPLQHVYFKIIFRFNSVVFQSSPNGITWKTEATGGAPSSNMQSAYIFLRPYNGTGTTRTLIYDDVLIEDLSALDGHSSVTDSNATSIVSIPVLKPDTLVGKDKYILAYNETENRFELAASGASVDFE